MNNNAGAGSVAGTVSQSFVVIGMNNNGDVRCKNHEDHKDYHFISNNIKSNLKEVSYTASGILGFSVKITY